MGSRYQCRGRIVFVLVGVDLQALSACLQASSWRRCEGPRRSPSLVTAHNPSTWSPYLLWAEYPHNSLTFCYSLSPLEASLGYQLPLFRNMKQSSQCPRSSITYNAAGESGLGIHSSGSSPNSGSQPLRASSCQLSPRYIAPNKVHKVISPKAGKLELPASLRIHPTFHVSQLKR